MTLDQTKGDLEIAKLYALETGYTYVEGDMVKRYKMSVKNEELSSFGIGLYFYLDFFKSFAKLLVFMSLCMIP